MMKKQILILLIIALAAGAAWGKAEFYGHHELPFAFKCYEGWKRVPRPGDEGTSEWVNPPSTMRVLLWATSTEQDAGRYLAKMADMKGLDSAADVPDTVGTHGPDALVLESPGTVLGVIHTGMSKERPRENILYIIQIICLPERHEEEKGFMYELIESVRTDYEGG